MNKSDEKVKKKGKGFAIAAAIFFGAAIWFAFLGVYLLRSIQNYKPPPDGLQEGDMVLPLLMLLLFAVAALCCAASLVNFVIYLFKRSSKAS